MEKIRIGILGGGRSATQGKSFLLAGAQIVALCDFNEDRLQKGLKKLGEGVTPYTEFDKFIEHEMDAVIIGNYFHEHAPFAIACLRRGLHVYSECMSNGTMAEGVELVRAAEESNAVYMLGENFPFMLFNLEMQRICREGTLGKILYAEGEYNHPVDIYDVDFYKTYIYTSDHWRNYNSRNYYITHSLAPLMAATGARPKRVTSFACFAPYEEDVPMARRYGDRAAIIMTQNDDESVFKFTGCAAFGAQGDSYRICGTEGQVENLRGMGNKLMLRYNPWSKPEGMEANNLLDLSWDGKDPDAELIKRTGHGGSDYIIARYFLDCIRENRQPDAPYDVYSATTMASVAILSHRSMLENGKPYDIPDLRCEDDRRQYENDRLSPYYGTDGTPPSLPCCSHPDYTPTPSQLAKFKELIGEK